VAVRLATRSWADGIGPGGAGVAVAQAVGPGAGVHTGESSGPEGPVALLIHGVTSSSRTWWRVAPELVRGGYRVLAVDLRGHGASPRAGDDLVLGDLTGDVLETLRLRMDPHRPGVDGQRAAVAAGPAALAGALGVKVRQDPAAADATDPGRGGVAIDLVVGHSLGAVVALDLLAKAPGLVRRLVLEEPPGPAGIDWESMAEGIRADGRRARDEPDAMRRELAVSNPAWDPEEVDRRLADLAACDGDGVAGALRRTTGFDIAGLADAVRVPTLLMVGLEDLGSALVGPDRSALVDALAGRAAFEVLDEGHNLHRDAFPRFMDVLDEWLDATARKGVE
jgi:pimeloyl-ACP methyl ester carboxylesterase